MSSAGSPSRGDPSAPFTTVTTCRAGYPRDSSSRRSASLTATTTLPSRIRTECFSKELCIVVISGAPTTFATG